MKKKLFEVTTLVYASSLKGVIEQGAKFGKMTGNQFEIIKVTLEDKPTIVQQNEQGKTVGFTKDIKSNN